VGYDEAGAHRMREAKQAPQADRLAHEERHRARALRPSLVAVEDLPCAGQRRAQLQALVTGTLARLDLAVCGVEQRVDLRGPRRRIDPRQWLRALDLAVLERWRSREVFAASLQAREGAEPWVFYEGPTTANGPPGAHHVLSRVFKDIYPRFKTMCGYRVERKG